MPLIPARDPIQRAVAQMQAQQEMQQQLQQILQSTIQNPHTSERVAVSLCVLAKEGPNHVLLVASPDGRRREIVLSQQAVQALARAAAAADTDEDVPAAEIAESPAAATDPPAAATDAAQDEAQVESGLAT